MPIRLLRLLPALAVAVATLVIPAGGAATAATGPAVHASLTAEFRKRLDARRRAHGLDPLFGRGYYVAQATTMSYQYLDGAEPSQPGDRAPATWSGWITGDLAVPETARALMDQVIDNLDAVLKYPLHTDVGAVVAVRQDVPGLTHVVATAIVGWPDRPTSAPSGCSAYGFCWSAGGLNPHLPWTRNQVKVYLSTANLPADGEYLLKAGIARLNRVGGFGADLVYGGRTTARTTSAQHRFLVSWSSSGCSAGSLACTSVDTQGTYSLILGARIIGMTGARRYGGYNIDYWIGTFAHELAHAVGLSHYDRAYAGSYQLMRWASGPNSPRSGDVNGLRKLAPPGRVSASLSLPSRVRAGQTAAALVRAGSSGLGGIRGLAVQCYDGTGSLRTFATRSGRWDVLTSTYGLSWTVPGGRAYASRCRAVASSKAARAYSAWVPVTLGG